VAQERLFRLAVESGVVTFQHEPRSGWRIAVRLRRGDETWAEAMWETYDGLSTRELLDVVAATLDSAL
jgi:uncharacterized protein YcnI